ncbi:oligosaccharide flippase family protein [Klebsiella sp. 2680]|uniref:oligosaccharide flippase family protein n=1 Tax=Klebsiella sp. 2680 TaxID=2018037 RepID=UPI001156D57F|nr:oligosaccharide flippase family protein [Klebsiella sp. 2680]
MSKVKKNIAWLMLTQISSYIFPLLTLPYLIRVLGINNYGVYALILAYSQYFLLLVDFGYNLTATRDVALNKHDPIKLSKVYWITMSSKLVLCILGFTLSFLMVLVYNEKYIWIMFVAYFSIIGNAFFPVWLFQGLEKMRYLSIISVISRTVVLICTFLLVKGKNDIYMALAVYSLTFLVPSIILNFKVWHMKLVSFYSPTFMDITTSLKLSFPVFISNFAISFYTNFNSILLSKYEPIAIVGSYYSADRVRIAAQTLLTPISQAIYPNVCDSQRKKNNIQLIKFGYAFMIVGFLISLGTFIFSLYFSDYYFGIENKTASYYLGVMSPIIFIVSIAMVFGHWFMAGNGYNKELSVLYTVCSIFHLFYSIPIVKYFGVIGLILASMSTQLIIALMMVLFYIKKRRV